MSTPLILQLNHSGYPVRWIGYDQAAIAYAKDQVLWDSGDMESLLLRGGINRLTGQQSKLVVKPIVAIRGHHVGAVRTIPKLNNKNLFARDKNLCAYCGQSFGISSLSRDHVLPTSRGGDDCWSNVVTSCTPCNTRKGARTPEEAGMGLLYIPYIPNKAESLILSNRRILSCQMEFLQSMISKNSRLLQ